MKYNKIDSSANKKIKELVSIRDGDVSEDVLLIEGIKIVQTAVGSGMKIEEILVTHSFLEKHENLMKSLGPSSNTTLISERVSRKLSDTQTPQGIFATMHYRLKSITEIEPAGITVVVDRVQDPGNLGTIIRTADAFGIQNIVLIEGTCSPSNQKVIRSSAGSLFQVNISKSSHKDFYQWAQENNVRILASDSEADRSVEEIMPCDSSALVLGNESNGVSNYLKSRADFLIGIPLRRRVESLNVAVASAIILYELTK